MLLLENRITQLDELLDQMAEAVQLDETRYKKMIQSYEAVKEWIENDEKFFKPYKYEVYPHGSVRIFTTVKPISRDEFDLDIVIHFLLTLSIHSPQRIYDELKRRLNEHDTYKKMLEAKSRCLRLNYSGDYHMDIMPGVQENEFDVNKIKVPDRKLGHWVSSNPRGYAEWFMGKANSVQTSLLERALKAEKIQSDDFKNKKPLQRAVQLIKRYRDMYFEGDDSYKTRSIILTTIAGEFYTGEESIFDTVDHIISTIHSKVENSFVRFKVLNPVNPEEDFTDKWDDEPEYFFAFKKFAIHLYSEWQKLKENQGVIQEGAILKGLFGDKLYESVVLKQTDNIQALRESGNLETVRSSGVLTSISSANTSPIKENTFYGNE